MSHRVLRVTRFRRVAVALLAVPVLVLAGCGSGGTQKTLNVFAAASLNKTFTAIGKQFETDNPEWKVKFTFAGSSDLVTQLTQGAKADVFASADTKNMDKLAQGGLLAGNPINFASNTLLIVAAPGNPKQVASFADLTKPGLKVVVCAPQVPCGSATEKVEKAMHVTLNPVSQENSVTDVLAAGDKVATVEFPESSVAVNTYPIAVLKTAADAAGAKKFVDLVTGEAGQKILDKAGFAKP
jgi:molybdate transport system substrate-binding protein